MLVVEQTTPEPNLTRIPVYKGIKRAYNEKNIFGLCRKAYYGGHITMDEFAAHYMYMYGEMEDEELSQVDDNHLLIFKIDIERDLSRYKDYSKYENFSNKDLVAEAERNHGYTL